MSFILDALKKSEADRQRNANPGIYELRAAAPRQRFPLWAVIVGVLLAINLVLGLWYLLKSDQPTPAMAASGVAGATAAVASTVPAAAAPATASAPATAPAMPDTGAVPPAATDAGRTDIERGIFNPADFEPAIEPDVTPPRAPTARPATPATAPNSSRGAEVRNPATRGLPSRDDLVLEGMTVPEVSMSLHVYDPDPARRFAFINGSRTQEGDMLPNGVRVQSITPEGAILLWQDRRFLLPLP